MTSSNGTSAQQRRTENGSRTSPSTTPGTESCTSARSRTCIRTGSLNIPSTGGCQSIQQRLPGQFRSRTRRTLRPQGPAQCAPLPAGPVQPGRTRSGRRERTPATGRLAPRHQTHRHNRTAAMKSRFLALRVRPASRHIAPGEDGSLPEAWLVAEWPPDAKEPTDYWLSDLPAETRRPGPGQAGKNQVAHRTRLPRTENRTPPLPLRGTVLPGLPPPRHPGMRGTPVHHQETPCHPKRGRQQGRTEQGILVGHSAARRTLETLQEWRIG